MELPSILFLTRKAFTRKESDEKKYFLTTEFIEMEKKGLSRL